jgi:aspartyl-tRNA(Asn)/glutamyl-tRNA(Gln) amidotransferase subunit A
MSKPWLGDACSLVDAVRAGDLSPLDALDASLEAIANSKLNAFSFIDAEGARDAARNADVNLPLGGVPIGVKELQQAKGWPDTEASVVFKDRVADRDSTMIKRVRNAGAVFVGLTTASEFGFVGYTSTKLNGTTLNPWNLERTPGGSSGGSAAAVAGGLVPIASGGDGGGSIRLPAGFSGLLGLKVSAGRIPRGPGTSFGALTSVSGCLARSVRDSARWLDVTNGYDPRDPYSLPRIEGWEEGLGRQSLEGLRAVVAPRLNDATVHPQVLEVVERAAAELVADAQLEVVDVPIEIPDAGLDWATAGLPSLVATFGDEWQAHADDLTFEIKFGLENIGRYRARHAAGVEKYRCAVVEAMARIFEQADLIICSTNPWEAFKAEGPTPNMVGEVRIDPYDAGKLTRPANIGGHPAISIPAGTTPGGLPVGMQVYANHHNETLLLDLALLVEQNRPWPLVAPGSPI